MSQPTATDITVIGGGLVGHAAARLLAEAGFKVVLIEGRAPQVKPFERVSAINPAVAGMLRRLGLWPQAATPYRHMQVWDAASPAHIKFDAAPLGLTELGHIIDNATTLADWRDLALQRDNPDIWTSTELIDLTHKEDGITLTTSDARTLTAQLLVAADGARSPTRRKLGLDSPAETFDQIAITARVHCEHGHQSTAWQCFLPTGPIALLPLPSNHCGLIWSCDTEVGNALLEKSEDTFACALSEHFARHLGRIELASPLQSVPLNQHHCPQYLAERAVLIGDAAHTLHPLAGLGANLGLLDAAALAEVLQEARQNRRSFHTRAVLRRYERWRRPENELARRTVAGFKLGFGSERRELAWLRARAMNGVERLSPLKHRLAAYACGLGRDVPAICRVPGA